MLKKQTLAKFILLGRVSKIRSDERNPRYAYPEATGQVLIFLTVHMVELRSQR